MKYIKRLQIKIIEKLLGLDKIVMIEEEEKGWLAQSYRDQGFKSYCKMRNLTLLKGIAIATEKRDFQSAIELNGGRKEILKLQGKAQMEARK